MQDGKQVAVLARTTLLANQHFKTFSERVAQFPVKVAVLSRFQSDAESRQIVEQLRGEIDILVGTHRLLQPTTRFKDLGLVIVDEEQRFGVEHKGVPEDHADGGRRAVDVGHPDPADAGDVADRHPGDVDDPDPPRGAAPGADLRRRLGRQADGRRDPARAARDGQVFVIHNRVQSIDKAAAKIRNLVPEARVAVGHGQMKEHELERIMVGFWEKEYDVSWSRRRSSSPAWTSRTPTP